jgi:hypothetical protein
MYYACIHQGLQFCEMRQHGCPGIDKIYQNALFPFLPVYAHLSKVGNKALRLGVHKNEDLQSLLFSVGLHAFAVLNFFSGGNTNFFVQIYQCM